MRPKHIDGTKCTACGLCLSQCSNNKLVLKGNIVAVTDSPTCIACGHCYAICPNGAILPENGLPPEPAKGLPLSTEELLAFLRSRRSHRLFTADPVPDGLIDRLVEFGRFAPTGTNTEAVRFHFIRTPALLDELRGGMLKVYRRFYDLMKIPLAGVVVPLFARRVNFDEIRRSLEDIFESCEKGGDPFFHHAPLVAFVAAGAAHSSTPYDDCCYASYNMVLGAETMGLATCLSTRAVATLSHDRTLARRIGIEKGFKAYSCIAIGKPLHSYKALPFRKAANVTVK